MIVETREWVGGVWEKLESAGDVVVGSQGRSGGTGKGIGDANEQERCKVLAAGVLVGIKEVVDQFQRLMVGDLLMD